MDEIKAYLVTVGVTVFARNEDAAWDMVMEQETLASLMRNAEVEELDDYDPNDIPGR